MRLPGSTACACGAAELKTKTCRFSLLQVLNTFKYSGRQIECFYYTFFFISCDDHKLDCVCAFVFCSPFHATTLSMTREMFRLLARFSLLSFTIKAASVTWAGGPIWFAEFATCSGSFVCPRVSRLVAAVMGLIKPPPLSPPTQVSLSPTF